MASSSLKKTLSVIVKNKLKILLIFLIQLMLFITLSLIVYHTMVPAMQHAKNAVDYYDTINNLNLTESSGMFSYLGEDPLVVYKNYRSMMYYIKFAGIFSVLAMLILNGLLWAITDYLVVRKTLKQSFVYFRNFGILTVLSILIFYVFIINTIKSSLSELQNSFLPIIGILVVYLILTYFILICFSLIDKRSLKEIPKLTFLTGIKKFPKIIRVYLTNLLIILLCSFLVYLTIEANMLLLVIAVILFVFSFVFARLFLIVAVNSLLKEK